MRLLILLIYTLALPVAHATAPLPSKDWQSLDLPGVVAAWTNIRNSDDIIIYDTLPAQAKVSFTGQSNAQIAVGITGYRRATLYEMGFKNWLLKDLSANKNQTELMLRGEYTMPSGVKKYFIERLKLKAGKMYQLSYISKVEPTAESSEAIRRTLEEYPL